MIVTKWGDRVMVKIMSGGEERGYVLGNQSIDEIKKHFPKEEV